MRGVNLKLFSFNILSTCTYLNVPKKIQLPSILFGTIPVKVLVCGGVGKQVILRLTQSSRAGTRTELGNRKCL